MCLYSLLVKPLLPLDGCRKLPGISISLSRGRIWNRELMMAHDPQNGNSLGVRKHPEFHEMKNVVTEFSR